MQENSGRCSASLLLQCEIIFSAMRERIFLKASSNQCRGTAAAVVLHCSFCHVTFIYLFQTFCVISVPACTVTFTKKTRWSALESEIALLKLTSIAAMQIQFTCSFAYINLQCIAVELNVSWRLHKALSCFLTGYGAKRAPKVEWKSTLMKFFHTWLITLTPHPWYPKRT